MSASEAEKAALAGCCLKNDEELKSPRLDERTGFTVASLGIRTGDLGADFWGTEQSLLALEPPKPLAS